MSIERKDIIIVGDEAGSMSARGSEPIQSLNSFINEQKTTGGNDSTISIWKFSTKPFLAVDDIPLINMEEFTDFTPSGTTALYDAIGMAILAKKNCKNVTCVIITDGIDNASHIYNANIINGLVTEYENKHGWVFHYIGANQDSFENGNRLGIQSCSNYTPVFGSDDGIINAMRNTSISIHRQRSDLINEYTLDAIPPPPPPPPSRQAISHQQPTHEFMNLVIDMLQNYDSD